MQPQGETEEGLRKILYSQVLETRHTTHHEGHVGKQHGGQEAGDRSKAEPRLEPLLGFPGKRQSRLGKTVQDWLV